MTVEKLWPNSTVVCIATGPSLTPEDVELCRGQHVIAVNDAYRLAPWADVLYACDPRWWNHPHHKGVPTFTGLKYSLSPRSARWPGVQILRNTGTQGIETSPDGLRTGQNSGYQAVNLAVHFGATRIVLLGYDMQRGKRSHFFGEHPIGLRVHSPYPRFIENFATMVEPLAALGISVVNCTRDTALTCFPRADLAETLASTTARNEAEPIFEFYPSSTDMASDGDEVPA